MLRNHAILVVSSAKADRALQLSIFRGGFSVARAENAESALDQLIVSRFDLLIIDLRTVVDAIELIKRVRNIAPLRQTTTILVVGEWGTGLSSLAMSAGADAYEASTSPARMIESVERLLMNRAAAAGAS